MGAPVDSRVRSCLFHLLGEYHTKFCKMSVDADSIIKICDIYDWDGKGQLDMYYFMDIFYALGFNITKKICDKYGQMDNVEKKFVKFDEVVKLVQQAVKEPEHSGEIKDCMELCKLYDKNDNGTVLLAGEEDEDGFIPYGPFIDKLCGKAPINPPTA